MTMIRKLGIFILGNQIQAITVTSMLSLLGLILPFFSYICAGVPPGLVTLRKGAAAGIQVITGSLVLTTIFALIANINPYIVFVYAMGIWLPVWSCSYVLRLTESQGNLVLSAGLFALLYILLSHLLIDDVTKWWSTWLDFFLEQAIQETGKVQLREMVDSAAPLMNAMTAAGFFLSLVTALLLARGWQSRLFNPGGFSKEFQSLRLPRWLIFGVITGLVFVILGKAGPGTLALDILVLLVFVYFFQGLACIHRLVAEKKLAKGWLFGVYIFIFIVPQVILFLACLGMADSWMIPSRTDPPNDIS